MKALARFAVRRRWLVVGAWLILIVALQAALSSVGGAHYKDDFKLPNTETATVTKLLTDAGLDDQNGASGTIVLHARTGGIAGAGAKVRPALQQLCSADLGLSSLESPYGTVDCVTGRTTTDPAARAALTSPDGSIGLVNVNWTAVQPSVDAIDGTVEQFTAAYTGQTAQSSARRHWTSCTMPRCRSSSLAAPSRTSPPQRPASPPRYSGSSRRSSSCWWSSAASAPQLCRWSAPPQPSSADSR